MTSQEPDFNALLRVAANARADSVDVGFRNYGYPEFSNAEYKRRVARLLALMEDQGLDGVMLTQYENIRFFSGYRTILWVSKFRPYAAIFARDASVVPVLVVPGQETGNAEETSWFEHLHIYPDQEDPIPHIAQALTDCGLSKARVGTELGFGMRLGMNMEQFDQLRAGVDTQFVDGTAVFQTARMVKSEAEVECIRRACEISQAGVAAGFGALKVGQTLRDIVGTMCSEMYRQGAEPGVQPSTFSITSGGSYKMVNALATDYRVRANDIVMVDLGAVYNGYATDFIRQACLGKLDSERQEYYDIAVAANAKAIEAVKPGVRGVEVYDAGMKVFKEANVFDCNLLTIVGHGNGLDVHEVPWLGETGTYTTETELVAGMVVCIEPVFGGYKDPSFKKGVWIVEDKVLVTETGSEVLTSQLTKRMWIQE